MNNTTAEKIFIGVSWPYANGNIHIGHLAGQYIVCDIFARYHRLKGNDVLMVSGSDSHGAPVIFAAEEQGITPKELSDKSHATITKTYHTLGLLYENYTTTRTSNHAEVSQNIFLVLKELDFLHIKKSRQYYDPKAKRFLPDRYVRGTCPKCGATNARGDECPECGEFLDPEDLSDPYSTLSDATPEMRETEHFYLDLKKTEPALKKWLKDKTYWRKWVREFTLGWLRGGLKPRAVTRDFSFGVPVPVDGWENKVLYVWIEAVVGYLSAAIEWAERKGDPSAWEDFWKDPSCKHYYFIAGGNVPFHTIIWPAEIIGYNGKYANDDLWKDYKLPGETLRKPLGLPYDVPANKILTYRGKKMSKGDKVGITLDTLMERYDPDVIRYFFARYAPENQDREFIWKDFIDANNNELVANIGNFINRVLTFTQSRFNGEVPEGVLEPKVESAIRTAFDDVAGHIEKTNFVKATESVLNLGRFANKYFNDEAPWDTIKSEPEMTSKTIYNAIQLVNALRLIMRPFLPFSAGRLADMLNIKGEIDPNYELAQNGSVKSKTNVWKFENITSGTKLGATGILFTKLEYTQDLEKEDNPEPDIHVTTERLPNGTERTNEHIIVALVKNLNTNTSEQKQNIVSLDVNDEKMLTVLCGDTSLKKGSVVPVALPGARVAKEGGGTQKIKEATIHGIKSEGMLCSAKELGVGEDSDKILILPKSFQKYLGVPLSKIKSVHFSKSPKLRDIPTAWSVFEALTIKKNRPSALDSWIEEEISKLIKSHNDRAWKNDVIHKSYRELHKEFGQNDLPGSPEDMTDFILDKRSLPTINSLVDLYNMFSAKSGISIGAHDIDKIQGQPRLEILNRDIPFRHAATNHEDTALKGEYAYIDDKGILCRLDIKQSNRTAVTKDTTNVLVLFQGNRAITQEEVDNRMDEFKKLVDLFVQE